MKNSIKILLLSFLFLNTNFVFTNYTVYADGDYDLLVSNKRCSYIRDGLYEFFSDFNDSFPGFQVLKQNKLVVTRDDATCFKIANTTDGLTTLAASIYDVLIIIIIGMSITGIAIAGIKYITEGIRGDTKGEARKRLMSALSGLILALTSMIILNTINTNLGSGLKFPDLTKGRLSSITTGLGEAFDKVNNISVVGIDDTTGDVGNSEPSEHVPVDIEYDSTPISDTTNTTNTTGTTNTSNNATLLKPKQNGNTTNIVDATKDAEIHVFGYKDKDDNGIANGKYSPVAGKTFNTAESEGIAMSEKDYRALGIKNPREMSNYYAKVTVTTTAGDVLTSKYLPALEWSGSGGFAQNGTPNERVKNNTRRPDAVELTYKAARAFDETLKDSNRGPKDITSTKITWYYGVPAGTEPEKIGQAVLIDDN